MIAIRIFAFITLLLAFPIALLALPWLPVTILIFLDMLRDIRVSGTLHLAYQDGEFLRLILALLLYTTGILAIFGLSGTVFTIFRACIFQKISWICAIIVGFGLPFWGSPTIGPRTDGFYVFVVSQLPIAVAVTALIGLFLSLRYSKIQTEA